MLRSLRRRAEFQRKAGEIYGAIVTQSRQPAFYARLGIPDTPTGRYEMVVIHLFLVLERLRGAGASPEAAAAAQALVDAFVADMDDSLRELGTGDIGVPRRVKRAAAGFYARAKDYREAIAAGGSALEGMLVRHLEAPEGEVASVGALPGYVQAATVTLGAEPVADVLEGRLFFPDPSIAVKGAP
jgi:cytochrome b pre-mRNA-processing protein 3